MKKMSADKQAMYNFIYRKHVHNYSDHMLFTLWWNITGSEKYDYLDDEEITG